MKNLMKFEIEIRVAYDISNKLGVKLGTVTGVSSQEKALVKFDLGYSRWVSIKNLEIVTKS